jgi:hypothetical protein
MGEGTGEIIIKGGSVALIFDDGIYQKASVDPSTYVSPTRRITRVLVTDEAGRIQLDSGVNTGLLWSIIVFTS